MRVFPRRCFRSLGTLAAALFFTGAAFADAHGVAPGGGGLEGVEATLKGATLEVRAGGATRSIALPLAKPEARISTIAIGEGRHVLHVHATEGALGLPSASWQARTWDAVFAGGKEVFAGPTGYTAGEDGERTGQIVEVTDRDDATKFVLVADVREDTRICGQATTPLSVRGLDAKTLALRGASLHRIAKKERDAATRIVAVAMGGTARPPLARLLAASGASGGKAPAITDGKLETAWSEERPGDGHGEFVAMRAPTEAPLHSLVVTPVPAHAPPAAERGAPGHATPSPERVAPRTFFVATDARLFHVTMPEDARANVAYEVPFPEPIRTSCVALVLDEAYDGDRAAPVVTIAEVAARTKLDVDGATFDDVAKELSGARADEAAAVLRRGGDPALAAVSARWSSLDAKARAFAVDVASSAGTCGGPAMELLTRALADEASEVRRRASGRIERCGKQATESLMLAVRSSEERRRAASAGLLASIAPAAAFDPLSEVAGAGATETRRAVRAALARAATATTREKLTAALARPGLTPDARLDLVRAFGPRLAELRPEAEAALTEVLAATPDMRTRWLVAEPAAQLGDVPRLVSLANDPEWPVRARALEASATLPAMQPSRMKGAADPHPRVREAALHAMAAASNPSRSPTNGAGSSHDASSSKASGAAAARALGGDTWTFVRVAAAEVLGATGAEPAALAKGLGDRSAKVRAAAVVALGASRAAGQASAIRARLDDTQEDVEVRALAARTLGKLCVQSAADRLTHLAILARSPVDEADERIGTAALEALGMLHPPDIEKRLAPLRDPKSRTLLKRAADAAVAERGSCR
ncbi:MAG: hypothetical protein KIT84_42560 [Labilithrix sp.]|nr:hypothetical protein [Labilithrix sp.]MCW5817760.1 hypothetical protein [Labilithrix sp.]